MIYFSWIKFKHVGACIDSNFYPISKDIAGSYEINEQRKKQISIKKKLVFYFQFIEARQHSDFRFTIASSVTKVNKLVS